MVLLKIDPFSVTFTEFECDAPRAVDVNRIPNGVKAFQRMEVETGDVHFFRDLGDVQTIKAHQNSPM